MLLSSFCLQALVNHRKTEHLQLYHQKKFFRDKVVKPSCCFSCALMSLINLSNLRLVFLRIFIIRHCPLFNWNQSILSATPLTNALSQLNVLLIQCLELYVSIMARKKKAFLEVTMKCDIQTYISWFEEVDKMLYKNTWSRYFRFFAPILHSFFTAT